jgi:TolA-binding protein
LIQDPKAVEILSQSPTAKASEAAMAAHISEHVAFAYRAKIEQELGVKLPGPKEVLPEDIELRLSRLVAPAAAQLTGKDQREAEMEQKMKEAEDPIIQMQQQELQIKQAQAQAKAQSDMAKIQADLQKAADKSLLEREKLSQQERLERAKLGARIAADNSREQLESKRIASKDQIEGAKLGKEIAKDLMDSNNPDG